LHKIRHTDASPCAFYHSRLIVSGYDGIEESEEKPTSRTLLFLSNDGIRIDLFCKLVLFNTHQYPGQCGDSLGSAYIANCANDSISPLQEYCTGTRNLDLLVYDVNHHPMSQYLFSCIHSNIPITGEVVRKEVCTILGRISHCVTAFASILIKLIEHPANLAVCVFCLTEDLLMPA